MIQKKTEPQKNGIAHSYAWCLKCKGAIIITYNKEEDSMDANKWKLRNSSAGTGQSVTNPLSAGIRQYQNEPAVCDGLSG